MLHATPLSGRHVALVALLNFACPALPLDPIVTDGSTGAPPDSATTTDPMTDGEGTTTASPGDTSTSTATPETTTTLTTDETTGTTGPLECPDNPDCPPGRPYCVDGYCADCSEVDCAQLDAEKPVCAIELGRCVQCQQNADCAGDTPACVPATGICVPCSEHEQCPETACNLETGACFPEDSVLYVDNTPEAPVSCNDAKQPWGLSPEQPLCTLQNALARLVEGQPTTIKIKLGSGTQNGVSQVPPGNFIAAIRHYGNTVPSLIVSSVDPALTISEGNTVFMHRIGALNPLPISDPLIACEGGATGARLWLDQQRITGGRTAIRANNCRVRLRRSTLTAHTTGGIDISGSDGDLAGLWVENSHINENDGSEFGAIRMNGASNADILYSTIALNDSPVAPLDCVDDWTGQLTIRNSALANHGPLYGAACSPSVVTSFEGNTEVDPDTLKYVFSGLVDGQLAAYPDGWLTHYALWRTGDPAIDADGDLRPTVDGAWDYAGADRATP